MPPHTSHTKPSSHRDWSGNKIRVAVKNSGTSIRQLSIAEGLKPESFGQALHRQYPNAERAIAQAIGCEPREIWPSRYERDGRPRRKRWDMPIARGAGFPRPGHMGGKHSSGAGAVNVNRERGNSRAEPAA